MSEFPEAKIRNHIENAYQKGYVYGSNDAAFRGELDINDDRRKNVVDQMLYHIKNLWAVGVSSKEGQP